MASFNDVVQQLITLQQVGQSTYWSQGDLLLAAADVYEGARKNFHGEIASDLGCSKRHVQMLMKTAKTFPPGTRAEDKSWETHRICATTKEPETWLKRALKGTEETLADGTKRYTQWSIADLKEAIAAEKEPGPAKDEAQAEGDLIVRRIRAFAVKWHSKAWAGVKQIHELAADLLIGWPSPLDEEVPDNGR